MRQSSEVLLTLARRAWMLALGLVWGGLLGGLVSLLMTPTYEANVYLMVVTNSEEVENTAAYDYTQAYGKLPAVPTVVGEVLSKHGIRPTSQNVEDVVDVEVPLNTPILQVIVSARSPELAAALANDLGDRVSSFVAETLAPGTGYRAVVVAEAATPQRPVSPDWTLNVAVGAAVGLMLGGATALLWDDLRRVGKKRKFAS